MTVLHMHYFKCCIGTSSWFNIHGFAPSWWLGMEDSNEEKGEEAENSEMLWQPRNYYFPPAKLPYAVILLNKGVSQVNVKSVLQWWCNGKTFNYTYKLYFVLLMCECWGVFCVCECVVSIHLCKWRLIYEKNKIRYHVRHKIITLKERWSNIPFIVSCAL